MAALWVVSFHVSGLWQGEMPLAGMGYLGVDLFFILSGFVLAHVHGDAFRRDPLGAYPHFLGRRIARIFPRLLASGPVRWLGERSYSLYVVHWLVLELLWAHADSGAVPKPVAAALMVGGAVVGAALLYVFVEQPARRYLRRRLG